jgi:predicted 3-demethylubiquinone-9 3-methyltransferase (glyoxalase superfamily)
MQKITPNLWFDKNAEEAVKFYTSVFKNSKIHKTTHYTNVGQEIHKMQPGEVMTIEFELNGQKFLALNGGPAFKFNESISFIINCKDQEEIDYYWNKLSEGGDPNSQMCGWLKDKYGLSWQVAPEKMGEYLTKNDETTSRVTSAVWKMKKLDAKEIERAYEGK